MANNPLDELVQSSLNPADNQQGLASSGQIKPSSVSSSNQNIPAPPQANPPAAPSSSISDNPLDHLIAEPASPSTNPTIENSPSSLTSSELGSTSSARELNTPQVEPVNTPQSPSPEKSDTSINPLDSLMSQSTAQTPLKQNDMPIPMAGEPTKNGASGDESVESPASLNPLPSLGGAAITQKPIPAPPANEPLSMPGVAEHDISVLPQVAPASMPSVGVPKPFSPPAMTPQPIPAASISPDKASTLSQKDLEEKAKKLLKESPPKSKGNKKPWILGLLTLLVVIGAAGGGLVSYQLLNPTTNNETAAVADGVGNCVMEVVSEGEPNESAGFGYKPASADINDATRYYDVSLGEKVDFNLSIKSTSNTAVSAIQRFYAVKVLESPVGTPVDASTPLDEATLIKNHQNAPFDVQDAPYSYKSPDQPFTLQPGESRVFYNSWRPTDLDCGLYQIDMNVEDTAGVDASCEPDFVAAAGFVRVVGCQELCGKECSSNATCESINPSYACSRTNQTSEWVDSTTGINAAGTGALTCFNSFDNVVGTQTYEEQHVVRNGRVWARNNKTGNWSAWTDATSLISIAGTETITGFSSFITKEGYTQQHVVKGGKVWARNNQGGSWQPAWQDVTANVSTTGSGTITGLNSFLKDDLYQVQFLVRGNEVYRRDSRTGWSEWEKVTQLLNEVGTGNITCYSGHDKQAEEMQRLVRGEKLWNYEGDWFAGECRLASNPSSQTCTPAPTPEALACTSLTKSPAAPKLGDVVSFTCAAAPSPVAKYEFRYTIAGGNYLPLNPEAASPNTAKLTVRSSGAHKVECRACEDAAGTKCTTWGLAK